MINGKCIDIDECKEHTADEPRDEYMPKCGYFSTCRNTEAGFQINVLSSASYWLIFKEFDWLEDFNLETFLREHMNATVIRAMSMSTFLKRNCRRKNVATKTSVLKRFMIATLMQLVIIPPGALGVFLN